MQRRYAELLQRIKQERDEYITMSQNDRVLLVDGMNMFIRTFCAVPSLNDDGHHVGGLIGFLRSLASVVREVNPTRVVVVFDGKGGSLRRKKIFSGYKEGRSFKSGVNRVIGFEDVEDQERSMYWQLSRLVQYLQLMPLNIISIDHVEADDIIAYLAQDYFTQQVIILSNDRDFFQILNDRISCWLPFERRVYTYKDVEERFPCTASNYIMYKAIMGDKSDGIPKVNGIGDAFIQKHLPLLKEESRVSVDSILSYASEKNAEKPLKGYEALLKNEDTLRRNITLMQLHDVDISFSLKERASGIIDGGIHSFERHQIKEYISEDKIFTAFSGFNHWIASFDNINRMRDKEN